MENTDYLLLQFTMSTNSGFSATISDRNRRTRTGTTDQKAIDIGSYILSEFAKRNENTLTKLFRILRIDASAIDDSSSLSNFATLIEC
jgi:hypothetical protein